MSDLISRQDAIDALGERPDVWTESDWERGQASQWDYDVAAIESVPPAQPELIERVSYIRGFEQGKTQGMIDAQLNLQPTCNKLATAQPEIIRCRDCKEFLRWIDTTVTFCANTEYEVAEDDFCSRAERRQDD